MTAADDAVARWDARNAPRLALEEIERAEARRLSRMFAFTRVDLMRSALTEAAYRTAIALGIPSEKCRAALVPDPATNKYKPALDIDSGWIVDEDKTRAVFGFAFRQVSGEWSFDLAYAEQDTRLAPQLAAALPRKEDVATFAERVKVWLTR